MVDGLDRDEQPTPTAGSESTQGANGRTGQGTLPPLAERPHRYRGGGVSLGQIDARLSDRTAIQTTRTRLRETFARLQARGAVQVEGVGTAIRRSLVER